MKKKISVLSVNTGDETDCVLDKQRGIKVCEVMNFANAIEELKTSAFDLVITGIPADGEQGHDPETRLIQEAMKNPDVRIIGLSLCPEYRDYLKDEGYNHALHPSKAGRVIRSQLKMLQS